MVIVLAVFLFYLLLAIVTDEGFVVFIALICTVIPLAFAVNAYVKSRPDRAKRAKAQKRKKVLEEINAARTVSDPNIVLVNNPDVIVGVNPNMDYELQAGIGLKLMAFVSLALSGYGIYMGLAYLVAL